MNPLAPVVAFLLLVFSIGTAAAQTPVIYQASPQPIAGGIGATVTLSGNAFGAAADTVTFPGNMKELPVTWGSGWVVVEVPNSWSGDVTVYSSASGLTSAPFPFEITFATWDYAWNGTPTFLLNNAGAPGCTVAETANRLQKVMSTWMCASGLSVSYGGTTTLSSLDHNDGQNVYGWSTTGFEGNPGLIGSASTAFNPSTGEITEADVTFNAQYATWSCTGAAGNMDVENVATHEFGHSLGLGDMYGVADSEKTMFGGTGNGETKRRTLWPTDVEGAEHLYPRAGRPNLAGGTPSGWWGPVVPRNTGDATGTWAPLPATLTGNVPGYVNYAQTNNGLDCASSNSAVAVYLDGPVDGTLLGGNGWAGTWAPGVTLGWNNVGITVPGGRHTLNVFLDSNLGIVESNEADNVVEAQFAWSPTVLLDQVPQTRGLPPTSGLLPARNCDGFEFTGDWWGVVGILPRNANDDYDLWLFDDYAGSTLGYQTPLAESRGSLGITDFVVVNGNVAGYGATRWVGTTRYTALIEDDYVIQQSNQVGPLLNPSGDYDDFQLLGPVQLDADRILAFHEVYLDDPTLTYEFRLTRTSGLAGLDMALFDAATAYMDRSMASAISGGTGATKSFNFQPPSAGYYGLVVYKSWSADLPLEALYEIEVGAALANLNASVVPPGFSAPAVPRNSNDGGPGYAPLPALLNGPDLTTYLNWSVEQEGPSNTPFTTQVFLDGVLTTTQFWPTVTEHAPGPWQGFNNAITVRGGRHTITVIADPAGTVTETNENDNAWSGQYIWEPGSLSVNTPVQRDAAPINNLLMPFPNIDGFTYSRTANVAWAIGISPFDTDDDYDLHVYDDYSSSTSGFSNNVGASVQYFGETDFVVGHFSSTPLVLYPGVVRFDAGAEDGFVLDVSDATGRNAGDTADYVGQILDQDRVVDVYEAYLTAGSAIHIRLERAAGSADLEFAVADGLPGTVAGRLAGEVEISQPVGPAIDALTFTATNTGWHPLVVFRREGATWARSPTTSGGTPPPRGGS